MLAIVDSLHQCEAICLQYACLCQQCEDYLERNHAAHVSWHQTLNNHASTRPKQFGGKIVPSVAGCKTFLRRVDPGSARLTWKCLLRIPHSFASGDNLSFCIERESETQDEGDENACRQAFAHLMLADASQVVFRQKHWTIPIEDVVAGLPLRPGVHQALPVHFRRTSALSSEAIAMGCMLEPDDRDQGLAA